MIPELGHFALILALLVAIVQGTLPLWNRPAWQSLAVPAAHAQFLLVALAFSALEYAGLTDDFSVLSVFENSHTLKPVLYKIAGVWANHEGSLVLWVLILALFGALVARYGQLPLSLRARTLAIQGLIATGFLAFILFTSNPFIRLFPAPPNGNDLNPILQDPGLAVHPPCLYLGYVGFSIVFSFAVAALLEGRCDRAWARAVKPWCLLAWSALTIGIGLGSWWAYYTLGWGGWWFWDPVENASLMPWLAGTALLHSLAVLEKRETLKQWTLLLSILTFSLSLLGTFLVRSGVLTSVHAFANDPQRGLFILVLLVLAVGGSLAVYARRVSRLGQGRYFAPISREGAIIVNNLLLATATATVFIGTLYPLFVDESQGHTVSVGPPYFNMTFVPLMVPLLALLAVGPLLAWKRAEIRPVLQRLGLVALLALATAVIVIRLCGIKPAMAPIGFGLAAWAIGGALLIPCERRRFLTLSRRELGMVLAHLGLGISVAGMTAAALFVAEKITIMQPGQTIELAGYELLFTGAHNLGGPNYTAVEGDFTLNRHGQAITAMHPQRRFYPVQGRFTTAAAIHTDLLADVYLSLGNRDHQMPGAYVVRFYHHPLVPWIWGGVLLMALGGLLSLSGHKLVKVEVLHG